MKFEKTQRGNPHKLTIKQHIFPTRSIERFVSDDGVVKVYVKAADKIISARPDDQVFCAKRVWGHGTEVGYMKTVEDKFQALADSIIDEKIGYIGLREKEVVNEFFGLWNLRSYYDANPIGDQKLQGIPGDSLSIDDQEILEKNNIGFIKSDASILSRQMTGDQIIRNMISVRRQLSDAQWGILRSTQGEFIVPDNFSNARVVPLTPTMCLFSESDNAILNLAEIRGINRLATKTSRKYFFAKDFSKCPI